MIVGNGLLANSFSRYKDDDSIIIFASGVSNSSDCSYIDFRRETNLLEKYLHLEGKKLVYFSTCSVYDDSINKNPYVLHKINVENIIRNAHPNYLIFRLPIVVGNSSNNNTFFNNIKNKIVSNESINVFKNATRYLMDVDDISNILPHIIDTDVNKTMNICFDNKMLVTDIINTMGQILSKDVNTVYIDSGKNYNIDNSEFKKVLVSNNLLPSKEYTVNLIKKYLKDVK